MQKTSIEERFWSKVDKSKGLGPKGRCWFWTASKNHKGYGRFGNDKAHRVAYELTKGAIPEGLILLHECDVRHCVRPSHLTPGTDLQNKHDSISKKRHAHGETHGRALVTAKQVAAIRKCHKYGVPQTVLAVAVGLSDRQISRLVRMESWRHIDTEGGAK